MNVVNGTDLLVWYKPDGGDLGKIYCSTSCTLNINQESTEASCKDSAQWAAAVPGKKTWDVSVDGLYDPDHVDAGPNDKNFIGIADLFVDPTQTNEVDLIFGEGGVGLYVWTGKAFLTSCSLTGDDGSPASWSCTFQGVGPLKLDSNPVTIP